MILTSIALAIGRTAVGVMLGGECVVVIVAATTAVLLLSNRLTKPEKQESHQRVIDCIGHSGWFKRSIGTQTTRTRLFVFSG